ncbi:MAG: cytochrome c biogenesis protein CcdA [Elusimicrobiales bacterium]
MGIYHFASAFAGGVLSFFTPCVFPLLPGYISMISGVSAAEAEAGGNAARRAGLASLMFVAGFAAVFSALGASASAIGGFLSDNTRLISVLAGIALVFFGLAAMGAFRLGFMQREMRFSPAKIKPGPGGAFAMGVVFALGWSPCIGPILAGFLTMAASQDTALEGCALLFAFSLGLGLPFVMAGFAVGKLFALMAKYRRFVRFAEITAGALLAVIGIMLIVSAKPEFVRRLLPL